MASSLSESALRFQSTSSARRTTMVSGCELACKVQKLPGSEKRREIAVKTKKSPNLRGIQVESIAKSGKCMKMVLVIKKAPNG